VAANVFSVITAFFPYIPKMCTSSHVPSRKRQIVGSQVTPKLRALRNWSLSTLWG